MFIVVHFKTIFPWLLLIIILLASPVAEGQRKKSRHTQRFHKMHYRKAKKAQKQCDLLTKKKRQKRNNKTRSFNQRLASNKSKPMAEVDPHDSPPPPKPKTQAVAKTETKPNPRSKSFEDRTSDEHHQITNEVLAENNLPQPTSSKHEEIRKKVSNKLKTHQEGQPIELAPLYFVYDDAEFSVVDMEPFLVAVEYALQGRMILIEGHTDSKGQDEYNVKLSMQRVEKIRQLMQEMGVPDDRISVVGYGEEIAAHDNNTEEGRQKNRRVDFKVF